MTDEELNKWNLRFCPKCRGHIQISFRRNKEGGIEIIRHCQNFNTCDFRSVLTKENITDNDRQINRQKEHRSDNSGLAKVAVQCSADTFVVNQSLVLRINICGENRHLRQAAKR